MTKESICEEVHSLLSTNLKRALRSMHLYRSNLPTVNLNNIAIAVLCGAVRGRKCIIDSASCKVIVVKLRKSRNLARGWANNTIF